MEKKKNIEYQLDIERKNAQNPNMEEYDFIYPFNHITSLDEQKVKVEELTKMIFAGEIQDSKTVAAIMAYKDKYVR